MAAIGIEAVEDLARHLRVGESTSTRQVLGCGRTRFSRMRCRIGSANDAVLPVPVRAMPTTSRPASASGMVWAWMGVGREIVFSKRIGDGIGEAEILKGGQKGGSFHNKKAGARQESPERAGVFETPAFGASVRC